jgi:hypothetical protein
MIEYHNRFMNKKITSVIMVVAIVIAVGAAAITINGYDSVYAESANRGQSFNDGSSHSRCTAVASGGNCDSFTDSGKHKGLLP